MQKFSVKRYGRKTQRILQALRSSGAIESVVEEKTWCEQFSVDDFVGKLGKNPSGVLLDIMKIADSNDTPVLLIGFEDFKKMMGVREPSLFDFRFELKMRSSYYGTTVIGIDAYVIPWMQGMVAVPKHIFGK